MKVCPSGMKLHFLTLVSATALNLSAANPAGFGPAAAAEQIRNLTVPEGLQATLFASEPMVRNPADMDIDARGRVWITEGANYRLFQKWGKLRPEGDRIVILEDTDGDGWADKETVFYQGNDINSALGICVLGNRVIVSCSPNIFVFTDTDGDDKADKKEVLFSGISGVDHDHGAHAFVFGPDGKLYFNMGNSGHQLKTADGTRLIVDKAGNEVIGNGKPYRQGLVFRCNLDGSELETLCWNFRNNYEVAVDSFVTIWQSDNDDDGNRGVRINFVMEFGNYGYTDELTGAGWSDAWRVAQRNGATEDQRPSYHWHQGDPGVVPNLLQTGGGSPTGIMVYEGNLLPDAFRNQIIHCDAGPRAVRAYPAQKYGAGYKAEMLNLLTSEDTWYRPSDVTVAPDGSVYVSDWNDAGVGGHNMADQKLEAMSGRIYRIAPKGNLPSVPKLDLSSPEGCVDALSSPNGSRRYLAWTKFNQMQGRAEAALLRLWNGSDARLRARALHLLARIKGKESGYVALALKDVNPDIRITGLRIARERGFDLIPLVRQVVNDPAPEVRRECAIALRHQKSSEAPGLWAQLAAQYDGKDRWYLEALGISADNQWDAYFGAWLAKAGDQWNTEAGRSLIWRSRSSLAPALLVKILLNGDTPAAEKARYLRAMDFVPKSPEKDAALAELAAAAFN